MFIRAKFSGFIQRNKEKFKDLGMKLLIVGIVITIATIMFSALKGSNNNLTTDNTSKLESYKPTKTIIKGTNVSEKQYTSDTNVVNLFLNYCNEQKIEEAYQLLTEDCRKNVYPTLESFKTNYYNDIFQEKREYNLQAWITTKEYTVYKIRYTNNLLETGEYNLNNIYEDNITLIKNATKDEISIGNFIMSEESNVTTNTNEIFVEVMKKNISLDKEEYEIKVKNKTQNTILLDTLTQLYNIELIGKNGTSYRAYINQIFTNDLTLEAGEVKVVSLSFKKSCTANEKSHYIRFSRVIRDYEKYRENIENYADTFEVKIKL